MRRCAEKQLGISDMCLRVVLLAQVGGGKALSQAKRKILAWLKWKLYLIEEC